MSRDPELYISDIINSCEKIITYTASIHFHDFSKDEKTYDAVVRNLEIIGEASKKLPEHFCSNFPEIEWKKIKGLRDIIVHEYFGLDKDIIWTICMNKFLNF